MAGDVKGLSGWIASSSSSCIADRDLAQWTNQPRCREGESPQCTAYLWFVFSKRCLCSILCLHWWRYWTL